MATAAPARTFGELVRQERQKLGLSQERLARMLDTSTGAVQSWERGDVEPTLSYYRRLCLAFGWPIHPSLRENGATRVYLNSQAPA